MKEQADTEVRIGLAVDGEDPHGSVLNSAPGFRFSLKLIDLLRS
jgi:hypothetical protein